MPVETVGKTPDQLEKFTIKVDGQDLEVTKNELIGLAQMGKDYTNKTKILADQERALKDTETRVAGLKAVVDEMEADPKLKETLNKVYLDYKTGKISKSDDKDRNLKKIDKLIEDTSDPAQREQLREVKDLIREQIPIDDIEQLKKDNKELKEELSIIKEAALIGHTSNIESKITKLEEEYGSDLVGKHKSNIVALATKYPKQEVENILFHLADKTEVRAALLTQAKKKEKEELERKKKGASPSGQEASFTAKTELQKDKAGRVIFSSLRQRILERLGKA